MRRLRIICSLTIGLSGLLGCSMEAPGESPSTAVQSALIGADTFLYFRCNATGWDVDDRTRLVPAPTADSFTLTYEVEKPWMVTGSDNCNFVETNRFNSWGTRQTYYDKSGAQLLQVPSGGAASGQLIISPPGNDYRFAVRYPKLGRYRVTVNLASRSFRIEPARPRAVDNSTSMYFPPIGHQQLGDCTSWSSGYYYSTYTQARDEGRPASRCEGTYPDGSCFRVANEDVVCSPWFLFSLISQGHPGAECTTAVMERLSRVGCASLMKRPLEPDTFANWPSEPQWIAALPNRPGPLRKVRADSEEGLETIRQRLADGGLVVTRTVFYENYNRYPADAPGNSNGVMYAPLGYRVFRHSVAIVGYDDDKPYSVDGQLRRGAFLIANSYGQDWGVQNSTGKGGKGFLWVAYEMFKNRQFGFYQDLDDENYGIDPCYDNGGEPGNRYPEVYFHDDRPRYRPRLWAVAEVTHEQRNYLTFTGGVGLASNPEFRGPVPIEETMRGQHMSLDGPLVVDLTDGANLIPRCGTKNVFVSLKVGSSAPADKVATISKVTVYADLDGDGGSVSRSATALPVQVPPSGQPVFVSVSIPGLCP